MPKPHDYDHLDNDKDCAVRVTLPMRELTEQICGLNYGAHRFLSHFVDVRRERLKKKIQEYREIGSDDVAEYVEKRGDALADGIEALLNQDLY
jgi:hypothetical protein